MNLKIRVERMDFDVEQCSLRLNGRNVEENEFVKMGQYHTLEIEIGHPFTIEKDCWDSLYLQHLNDACDPGMRAEIAAVVMQEGLANVCLITSVMTLTRAKIEKNTGKKKLVSDCLCLYVFVPLDFWLAGCYYCILLLYYRHHCMS